jgi:phage terminase large subunit-like protein
MCAFSAEFDRDIAGYSPDRVDALVWALTELFLKPMPGSGIFELLRQQAEARTND